MKTTLSVILVTATVGALAAKLANAAFLATVPGEVVFAVTASLALIGITLADYARAIRPLTVKAPITRVELPTGQRSNAYSVRRRSALVERTAA